MEILEVDILQSIIASLEQQNYENAKDIAFHSFLVGSVYQRLKMDITQLRSFITELSNVVYLCQYLQKQQTLNEIYKTLLSNQANDPAAYIQKEVKELLEKRENTEEKHANLDLLESIRQNKGQVELENKVVVRDQEKRRQEEKQTSKQQQKNYRFSEDTKIIVNEEEGSQKEEQMEKEIEEEEESKENFILETCLQNKTQIVSYRQLNSNNNNNNNNNEEWECEICLETMKGDIWPLECQHIFHRHCLDEYFKTQIKQKKLPVKCPNLYCMIAVAYQDLKEILSKEYFLKFEQFSMNHYLENNADEITCCPTPDCQYAFILEDGQTYFHCPSCLENYCLACKSLFHDGQTCREYQISNNYSDRQFEKLVQRKKFKQCGKCKMWVEKNQGCDHMTCRCTYQFCYICGGPYKNCLCTNQQSVQNPVVQALRSGNENGFVYQHQRFVAEMRNTVVASSERVQTEILEINDNAFQSSEPQFFIQNARFNNCQQLSDLSSNYNENNNFANRVTNKVNDLHPLPKSTLNNEKRQPKNNFSSNKDKLKQHTSESFLTTTLNELNEKISPKKNDFNNCQRLDSNFFKNSNNNNIFNEKIVQFQTKVFNSKINKQFSFFDDSTITRMKTISNQISKTNMEEKNQCVNDIQVPGQKQQLLDSNLNHRRNNYIPHQNRNTLIFKNQNMQSQ